MSNRPSKGNLHKNNIVIVCEGTDTEYNYFDEISKREEVRNRFDYIKVVPHPKEKIKKANPKRPAKGQILSNNNKYHYYIKYEADCATYEQYKAQPLRYVREAYLFMAEDQYAEAWAVFDHDGFAKRKDAFEYANECGVNIAFSSRCFEEWFLLHFERNEKTFQKSDCTIEKDGDEESMNCGTGINADDCHGSLCIAGRLREQQYISDYGKDIKNLYENYTVPRLNICYINAAWSRSLSNEDTWERNPYTDVDKLIGRLTGIQNKYVWHALDNPWGANGSKICVTCSGHTLQFRNLSSKGWLLKHITWLDVYGKEIGEYKDIVILRDSDSAPYTIYAPDNALYCVINKGDEKNVFELI